ncbi:MAG: sodium/proline symporter [Thermoprotei archaeon]|nr:MAG: sodium/proline symporter [Thermoprotei archaeon]
MAMPVQVTPEASTVMFVSLGIYFVIVLIIGIILERFVKSVADYFLGGRRLGPYVIAFSERASEMSGWVGLGLPGEGFTSGINATWNTIGCFMGIGDLGVWTLMAKRLRRYTEVVGALTIPSYLEARFNDTKGVLRFTSAVIIILFLTAYVGAQFTAAAKVFSAIAGGGSVTTWIVVGAIIMILYTVLGGFFAVCWTDFVQGWWALIGLLIITSVGLAKYGGFGGLFQKMAETDPTLVNLNCFWGYEYIPALVLVNILAYIAIGFGWPGNPHIIVRFMGIKKVKDMKKAAVTALLLLLVVYYLAQSVGWLARVEFGSADNLVVPGDPEYSLQSLAISWLPPAAAGIILAAPLALMMSTADSQLLVSASAIIEDIYHRFINPKAEERKLVLWSRITTFLLGIIALIWALFFGESVYLFVLFAWGGLGAAFGSIMLLSLRWKRITTTGALQEWLLVQPQLLFGRVMRRD